MGTYRVARDNAGQWYWVWHGANGEPIARSSESYVHKVDALHAIELIKQSSADEVEEEAKND